MTEGAGAHRRDGARPGGVAGPVRALAHSWRSSLQLRVVLLTTALCLAVIGGVGSFLLDGIGDGLVAERQFAAMADAARGTGEAQARFDAFSAAGTAEAEQPAALEQLAADVVAALEGTGPDRVRRVLLLRAGDPGAGDPARVVRDLASAGLRADDVPAELRRAVTSAQQQQHLQIVAVGPGRSEPVLMVGSTVTLPRAGTYELYFVYSLVAEQQTLDLVRTTFLGGGIALVVLISAVAWLVARVVLEPVRQAAGTAERLTSGRLDERMPVRGTDELARLASAFNEMAAGMQQHIGQLEELSRLQRRFVSDVSHELRTPLTTIRMAGEVIFDARTDFDPVVARSAELMQTQLDRFEVLLADLLDLSRFDAGAAALEAEPVDLRHVVARAIGFAGPLAESRGSELRVAWPTGPCTAEVDARRIERVLRNLVGNAVEHGEGRPIEITVVSDQQAVAVGVRDYGVGLEPEHLARVFDRFWRADPARARTTGGSGLGLAIALEDTRLHGGWLQVWGRPGRGCHFVLTLPRSAGGQLVSSPLPVAPAAGRAALPPAPVPAAAEEGGHP
ncbi:two-component system sensor histidine kinase MtrB [Kineococcus xinjiangensis]|uniref:Sensor histidine kinase MtrB n=1 Tax=Kineococcus xinjiangensis TaxID=512762 RepID=A0A2S6IU90_9ACTN|nr:MtrAB system histidine kinase MtrB [Kineococcus xinjiangensis]PPK97819.1 two-component system sensor histidine kinase MtrB [Kineococcus xinjiangensis]